jgi:hypothetical protein
MMVKDSQNKIIRKEQIFGAHFVPFGEYIREVIDNINVSSDDIINLSVHKYQISTQIDHYKMLK